MLFSTNKLGQTLKNRCYRSLSKHRPPWQHWQAIACSTNFACGEVIEYAMLKLRDYTVLLELKLIRLILVNQKLHFYNQL